MRIAVIVPACNAAPFIADAVRSALAQSHPATRLIVIDDGSTDATAAVVQGFAAPRLTLLRQPNSGVSAARNRGIEAAHADALLFLDADDWLAADALARLAAGLAAAPHAVAAIGSAAVVTEGAGRQSAANAAVAVAACDALIRAPPGPTRSSDLVARLLVRNLFVNGGHLLLRRDAIRAAGGFDPRLSYGEDWEYWVRVALQGEFTCLPQRDPVLFTRSRADGAYRHHAADPNAFGPCMAAIWGNPALAARFTPSRLTALRRHAEAENAWIIGRERVRQGRHADGRRWLTASVAAAPSARRLALLAIAHALPLLPLRWRGPFQPYPA